MPTFPERHPIAQRGYYRLPGAAAGLQTRTAAVRRHVLSGNLLDIGCNDGSIAKSLLTDGLIRQVHGIDLEVLHDHFPVTAGNILDLPSEQLRGFDNVLYLNVHHHLLAATTGTEHESRPQQLLHGLVGNCRRLFFEMGSVTERGNWGWLQHLRSRYRSDVALFRHLFGQRMFFEILRYPMQGGVRRMLLVFGNAPDHWAVTRVQWYARNVAAHPLKKRLATVGGPRAFPPGPVGHAPNDWMPSVKFVTFEHEGRTYFGKRHRRTAYNIPLTLKIYEALRGTPFADRIIQPLYYSTKFGIVWEYDAELMMAPFGCATVVHAWQASRAGFGLNQPADLGEIESLAKQPLTIDGITKAVRQWCDFQIVKTTKGLQYIDFDAY